jgi:hypothetical protein
MVLFNIILAVVLIIVLFLVIRFLPLNRGVKLVINIAMIIGLIFWLLRIFGVHFKL